MSRKCPSCKKWLASGQYVCKCGHGETQVTLPPAEQIRLQDLARSLQGSASFSYGEVNLARDKDAARAAEAVFARDECAVFACSSGDFWRVAIQCDMRLALAAFVKHCKTPLHELKDLESGLSPLWLALIWGRAACLEIMLTRKDLISFDFVEPRIKMKLHELAAHQAQGLGTHVFGFQGISSIRVGDDPFGPRQANQWGYYGPYTTGEPLFFMQMVKAIDVARGEDTKLAGVEGMALRAQKAAVSAEIVTPDPFPRQIWVMIVSKCHCRERDVVLPLCARFFRNLLTPIERLRNIMLHFGLLRVEGAPVVGQQLGPGAGFRYEPARSYSFEAVRVNPALLYVLAQSVGDQKGRLYKLLEREAMIERNRTLAKLLIRGKYSEPRDAESEKDTFSIQDGPLQILFSVQKAAMDKPRTVFKLAVSNRDLSKRVTIRVATMLPIGNKAGGTQQIERFERGCALAATLIGDTSWGNPRDFIAYMATVLQPSCLWIHGMAQACEMAAFFTDLFVGTSSELEVKESQQLDLSQSTDDGDANTDQAGGTFAFVLRATDWNKAEMAKFFEQHGLGICSSVLEKMPHPGKVNVGAVALILLYS
jgi:hypothetical protein